MTTAIGDAVLQKVSDAIGPLVEEKVNSIVSSSDAASRIPESPDLTELIVQQAERLKMLTRELSDLKVQILNPPSRATPAPVHSQSASSPFDNSCTVAHGTKPYLEHRESYIGEELAKELVSSFSDMEFSTENGRSVRAFGVPYHYPGSNARQSSELNGKLKDLVDSLNDEFCSGPACLRSTSCSSPDTRLVPMTSRSSRSIRTMSQT